MPAKKEKGTSSRDIQLLSTLAHLSILAIFITGPFVVIIPLILWLMERNRPDASKALVFHAKQAFFYQLAFLIIGSAFGIIVGILSIILIGLLLIPFLIIGLIVGIGYGVYGGIQVSQGKNFRYLWIGDFVE